MKITKLPDDLDVNKILANKILKLNGNCPFCGEHVGVRYHGIGEYRKYSGKWWHLWESAHYMVKYEFECCSCGCTWESDWFPQDIKVIR